MSAELLASFAMTITCLQTLANLYFINKQQKQINELIFTMNLMMNVDINLWHKLQEEGVLKSHEGH